MRLVLFLSLIFNAITVLALERPLHLDTEADKLSYGVGVKFAYNMAARLQKQNIKIKPEIFIAAIEDVLKQNPLALSEQELKQVLSNLNDKLEQNRKEEILQRATQKYDELFGYLGYPEIGANNAKFTIVAFIDYQCPQCKYMQDVLAEVTKSFPNVRIIYRDIAILGPNSELAARYALASIDQDAYLKLHNAMLIADNPLNANKIHHIAEQLDLNTNKLKQNLYNYKVDRILKNNINLAAYLGVNSTPTFFIARTDMVPEQKSDIKIIEGKQNADIFINLLKEI